MKRTNREAALSDVGIAQVEETCKLIEEKGITLTFVKYSFAAAAMDSANIVGKDLKVCMLRMIRPFPRINSIFMKFIFFS